MPCGERYRLLREYHVAVRAYSHAVIQLLVCNGITQVDVYKKLLQLIDDTGNRTELARGDLSRHLTEHGCLTKP